jgi:hypothetical protein
MRKIVLISVMLTLLFTVSSASAQLASVSGDSYANAIEVSLNQSVIGYINSTSEDDFYKFDVPFPGRLDARMESVPDNVRASLMLSDSNEGFMAYVGAAGAGDLANLGTEIVQSGLYYLKVSISVDGDINGTEYMFRLNSTE